MEFKGTEKWVLGRIEKSYQYISGEGWDDFARVVVKMKGANYTSSMGEANAKLIAAAPENILEHQNCKNLLKMILTTNQLKDGEFKKELIMQIRISEKAIEKALK